MSGLKNMPGPKLPISIGSHVAIRKEDFDTLLDGLRNLGYETVGPRIREQALVYAPINGIADLPKGYLSEQDGGHYRLIQDGHSHYFDITPGAQSWKQFLFPPRSELFKLARENGHWREELLNTDAPHYAFIGVRGCELAAIAVQDKVFLRDDFNDPIYKKRRENIFVLAADCFHPCATCFCASMGTGPDAGKGFDLRLTELDEVFLIEVGSHLGTKAMQGVPYSEAMRSMLRARETGLKRARLAMGRELPEPEKVPELLLSNLEHPRWKDVAARCLSCTNCTQVCPTCFCWDVEDLTSLDGNTTQRTRVWDSCFSPPYSSQAFGNTRPTTLTRYRQWLTHKMGSWQGQIGVLGCIGCGRCITWCPPGIDLTEEIKAIRQGSAILLGQPA